MATKLTTTQALDMTDDEITAYWFKGASVLELRALRDYVEDDAIIAITKQEWRGRILMDSCWRAIDAMFVEEGY